MAQAFAAAASGADREARCSRSAETSAARGAQEQAVLVATHTCPNCGAAKKMLEKAGIDYRVVYADEKQGADFAERNNIIQAPTLLMPGDGGYRKLTNIGEISGFLKKQPVLRA